MSTTGKSLNAVQGAADQAAPSDVANEAGGGASPTTRAKGAAANFGFVDGINNTTFTGSNPPSTAACADNAGGPAAQLGPGSAVPRF